MHSWQKRTIKAHAVPAQRTGADLNSTAHFPLLREFEQHRERYGLDATLTVIGNHVRQVKERTPPSRRGMTWHKTSNAYCDRQARNAERPPSERLELYTKAHAGRHGGAMLAWDVDLDGLAELFDLTGLEVKARRRKLSSIYNKAVCEGRFAQGSSLDGQLILPMGACQVGARKTVPGARQQPTADV